MSAVVIDLHRVEDQRDVVHRVVQALAEGQLIAFPTETVYGVAASALHAEAVERLVAIKGRSAGHPLALAIKSADDALDYVPDIPPLAERLTRRCWPGPLTLVLDDTHPDSVTGQLARAVREVISPHGTVGLRVPAHDMLLSVLRLSAGPLVLTSANLTGEPDPTHARSVMESLGGSIDLILDDGPCKFGQPSSVVHVRDNGWEMLRAGVLNEQTLRRLASYMILLVCTGNTCRSPMAAAILRHRLSKRLAIPESDLEDRGLVVLSAGVAAMVGGRATPEAVQVMQERQLDLTQHESQPLSDRLVRFADLLLTMTRGHREAILAQWPNAARRTHTLGREHGDVPDPIGGTQADYRRCADQITDYIHTWIEELELDHLLAPRGNGG